MEPMPESVCWLYAVGCLENRYNEKTLSREEYLIALEFVRLKAVPSPVLIRKWFPKPFEKLEPYGVPCSYEEMQNYWRNTHTSSSENTPVFLAEITSITTVSGNHTFVRATIIEDEMNPTEEKSVLGQNLHGLKLVVTDWVYIHGSVVAEKAVV